MGINIKDLGLGKERVVREAINSPQGRIEVYEPTLEDAGRIVDLQRELGFGMESSQVSFTGRDVIKSLFPMLTNIDFGDITDEELDEIIDNPSLHLLIAQQVVAQIVADANKLYVERVKTEIVNSESAIAQVELLNSIPAMIINKAKKDGKVAELLDKVEEIGGELEEAIEKESLADNVKEA